MNQGLYLDLSGRWGGAPSSGDDELHLGHGLTDAASRSAQPSPAVIRDEVVPALLQALASGGNDLTTGALMALAKIGSAGLEDEELVATFLPYLARGNQEVSETAALALGMLQSPAAVVPLFALLADDEVGSELVDGGGVSERTRAFAAFGLGLIGRAHEEVGLRRAILLRLTTALEEGSFASEEVPVACVSAIGLLPLDGRPTPPRADEKLIGDEPTLHALLSRRTQIKYLIELLESSQRSGRIGRLTRAHLPLAIARLCEGAPPAVRVQAVGRLLESLRPHARTDTDLVHGVILALGILDPRGLEVAPVLAALAEHVESRDPMARAFAILSLARLGGRLAQLDADSALQTRALLGKWISDPRPSLRPWIALACGVFLHEAPDPGGALSAATLMGARECGQPEEIGAWALGVGLQAQLASESTLIARLSDFAGDQPLAFLATGLGLTGDHDAHDALSKLLLLGNHRPELLLQVAIGLVSLADSDLSPQLIEQLESTRGSVSQAGVARALGLTGDARALEPLLALLADKEISEPVRAFAAIGLGLCCDDTPWPWNSPYSIDINYLAATTSLVGDGRGVLEIL
jgi:HEAT repeat protein